MTQQKNLKSTVNADGFEQINHTFYQLPLQLSSHSMSIAKDSYQPCYFHQEVEFIYILDGAMVIYINGAVCHLNKGQGLFINTERLHVIASTGGSRCSYMTMIFDSELVRPSFPFTYDVIEQVTNESAPDYVHLRPGQVKESQLLQLIMRVYRLKDKTSVTVELDMMRIVLSVWSILIDLVEPLQAESDRSNKTIDQLKQMLTYIHLNYQNKLNLDLISKSADISRSHSCDIFREELHSSPIQYLQHYRLYKSLDLLLTNDLSVTEIAYSVGFNSLSYYTETFRKVYDVTPSQYRKDHR
ncbi:AraC family transcriptional regulator [Halolactibacillus miurensis]|uniref:AraC family transcriptional regulator n=1 Tax=Halolactibacillus miurensis TaxID=306541 RepID=A0A1I6T002_9BACI|nr:MULTISPECIES: AraC family transcriptional regulator [Halolactibacillus]GEM04246.1 AraC family transcriptional regulator [Halolactibacillus miurensis]SFS82418.1 AraC-type DNA-binding protein [Halolactibacillus miurensis]